METTRARELEFEVSVDADRGARSGLGGTTLPREDEWWAEHLVLAGLVRCTLASADHAGHRAGLEVTGSGSAHGTVTKRVHDGLYAFVEIDVAVELALEPVPEATTVREVVARAERGCFVGNSLTAPVRYRWRVNGEDVG